jgi:hypothetical protein
VKELDAAPVVSDAELSTVFAGHGGNLLSEIRQALHDLAGLRLKSDKSAIIRVGILVGAMQAILQLGKRVESRRVI